MNHDLTPRLEKCYQFLISQRPTKKFSAHSLAVSLGYSSAEFDGQGLAFQDLISLEAQGLVIQHSNGIFTAIR